jgi:chemotaxis protein histidine kinase CheA
VYDEFLQDFIIEVGEHIENIEMNVLELENDSYNIEIIHNLFRSFHTIKGLAGFVNLKEVKDLAHETETLLESCRKGKTNKDNNIIARLLKSLTKIKVICEITSAQNNIDFLNSTNININSNNEIVGIDKKVRNMRTPGEEKANEINIKDIDGVINVQDTVDSYKICKGKECSRKSSKTQDKKVYKLLSMVTLKPTFQKLKMIGRDTASELNKNVSISLTGEQVEIERSIAEKIFSPLMHLLHNAISHGIEDENRRTSMGKLSCGHIQINAAIKRGIICIEVADDGWGIDIKKVYEKAIALKIIDPGLKYSDSKLINLIFLPGFTTADDINCITGRGIGLDIVKTEISKICGEVDVINSPGNGSKFILKIPINPAAINDTIIS